MSRLLVYNIATLAGITRVPGLARKCGADMAEFDCIHDAYLLVDDGRIADFGLERDLSVSAHEVVDARRGTVLPSFCDSHTHLVYAGSREQEFVDKINGLSYAEIARRGGGILNSADRLHHMSADELKMLRVVKRIKRDAPLKVVSTFLGAHAVGRDYAGRQSAYVDLVVDEMIPAVAAEHLADYVDVFCDEGFFTPAETARIIDAGARYGMRAKIHGQELAASGGVEVAVSHNALSVDHLESMTGADIELLRDSATSPTVLPGTSFFLNMPYAPARKMIDAGLGVAIASDYNPGSTPSGDMKFAVSLSCIKMRLQPAEALNAATLNGAYAMGLSSDYGSIAVGKVANFVVTKPIPSLAFIPYAYTTPIVQAHYLAGKRVC